MQHVSGDGPYLAKQGYLIKRDCHDKQKLLGGYHYAELVLLNSKGFL